MSKLRIRYFGPINEGLSSNGGWIEIRKVTVLTGNQGTGKSTIAKLISTFTWIEKSLVRGDYSKNWFEHKDRFQKQVLSYHRLENYFQLHGEKRTEIEFLGDAYHIHFLNGFLKIKETETKKYSLPQILYIPAERNFISHVRTPKELKMVSESLREFVIEFDQAKKSLKEALILPINNTRIEYDQLNDIVNLGGENYKLKLSDSSSGFQSLVPLYLVTHILARNIQSRNQENPESMSAEEIQRFQKGVQEIWENSDLTDEQKRVALSVLSSKFNKTSFVNIVEEPEQNLYPDSQWLVLQKLLANNNLNEGNQLILSTHSPYIINYLSIAVQGNVVKNKISSNSQISENQKTKLYQKLYDIIPNESLIASEELAIYQLSDNGGSIELLETYEGIPSDQNYLNKSLIHGNTLFDKLLELEDSL